jgi:HAMP domain-containing protein
MSICAVSIFAVNTVSKDATEDQIYAHLETTVQSRAHHIETFLNDKKIFTEELALIGEIERILLANKSDSDYNDKIEAVNERLQKTVNYVEGVLSIVVMDKLGIVIAGTNKNLIGMNGSNNEAFLYGKKDTYVQGVNFTLEGTKEPIMFFSTPVTEDNEFLGVVVLRISTKYLNEITTDKTGLGETGEVYLINKEFIMITPSRIVEDAVLNQKVDTINARNCFAAINETDPDKIAEIHSQHAETMFFKDYRGTNVLGTHAYIPDMKWGLLAEIDAEEALTPITIMQNTVIIIFIIIGIFSMLFAYFFSISISKPIIKLKDAANSVRKGNFDAKIDIKSKDEIGELADAFNDMAKDLKEQQGNLEKAVAERTKELNKKIYELQRFKKVTVDRELKMRELKKRIKDLEGSVKK